MTDIPACAFLLCGRTPLELAASVHCGERLAAILREAGFPRSGFHTAIPRIGNAKSLRQTRRALELLCRCADLVITCGCEGFRQGDVLPDITEFVSTGKAGYFAGMLCGAQAVAPPPVSADEAKRQENGDLLSPASQASPPSDKPAPFCAPPSRATAGLCGSTLILNFSNDVQTAPPLLCALLPAIRFSVLSLSGKNAEELRRFEQAARFAFPQAPLL